VKSTPYWRGDEQIVKRRSLSRTQSRGLKIVVLAAFILLVVLSAEEYRVIQTLVAIICTSCIGVSG
jgi:hypothetical protein